MLSTEINRYSSMYYYFSDSATIPIDLGKTGPIYPLRIILGPMNKG